jgi:tetratricopeptide (TPR) repeat protein
MAKRIEKHNVSSRVKYTSLLLGISASLVSIPAFADDDGGGFAQVAKEMAGGGAQASTAVDSGELTYDQALQELMRTNNHTKAATDWGKPRTVAVPKGADPDRVIQEQMIKAPGIRGMDRGTIEPSKASASAIKVDGPITSAEKIDIGDGAARPAPTPGTEVVEESGWDWVGKQQQQPTAASTPKARTGFTTVFDASQGTGTQKARPAALSQDAAANVNLASDNEQGMDESSAGATDETAIEPAQEEEGPPRSAADVAKDAINIYNSAVKLHLAGKLEEAITEYREALNANPELSQAHCNLGLIFNQQHDYAKALIEFQKALAIEPKDAITYNGIGAALRAQKDMDGAIKNWSTAVSIDPHLATAHYNLGTVYEMQKEYDKAMESYSLAIKNDFRLGEAYYRTGLILLKKNRSEDAKEQFNKALQVSKNAEFCADARKRIALIEHPPTR